LRRSLACRLLFVALGAAGFYEPRESATPALHAAGRWHVAFIGNTRSPNRRSTKAPTKDEAVRQTIAAAKKDLQPVSVRIHKQDGRIQEERTYPRSADPRRSKG
jgi:hypothetical protein